MNCFYETILIGIRFKNWRSLPIIFGANVYVHLFEIPKVFISNLLLY